MSTSPDAKTASNSTTRPSHKKGRKTDSIINTPLQSADIPVGQYPAVFMGFSEETFEVPSKFRPKQADGSMGVDEVMSAYFAVRVDDRTRILHKLVKPPKASGLSSDSKLYEYLKILGKGDPNLCDGDNLKRGVSLAQFIGKTVMVSVGKDKKNFARVDTLALTPDGIFTFPTTEEATAALQAFKHSGEDETDVPNEADVPF